MDSNPGYSHQIQVQRKIYARVGSKKKCESCHGQFMMQKPSGDIIEWIIGNK